MRNILEKLNEKVLLVLLLISIVVMFALPDTYGMLKIIAFAFSILCVKVIFIIEVMEDKWNKESIKKN